MQLGGCPGQGACAPGLLVPCMCCSIAACRWPAAAPQRHLVRCSMPTRGQDMMHVESTGDERQHGPAWLVCAWRAQRVERPAAWLRRVHAADQVQGAREPQHADPRDLQRRRRLPAVRQRRRLGLRLARAARARRRRGLARAGAHRPLTNLLACPGSTQLQTCSAPPCACNDAICAHALRAPRAGVSSSSGVVPHGHCSEQHAAGADGARGAREGTSHAGLQRGSLSRGVCGCCAWQEKSAAYECFHAHSDIVTVALFAPAPALRKDRLPRTSPLPARVMSS